MTMRILTIRRADSDADIANLERQVDEYVGALYRVFAEERPLESKSP